jgi:hypothetical protein
MCESAVKVLALHSSSGRCIKNQERRGRLAA